MGRGGGTPRKPPALGGEKINGDCVECRKKKTLCINVRRPAGGFTDYGHTSLTLGDGEKFETFGNWPKKYSKGAPSTVKKDFNDLKDPASPSTDNPENDRRYKERKCKEITEEQEKKLREAAQNQAYDLTDKNCAKWAGTTWNSITGDNLDYGGNNWFYNSPTTLGDSIKGK
jgi:hypothetical protein